MTLETLLNHIHCTLREKAQYHFYRYDELLNDYFKNFKSYSDLLDYIKEERCFLDEEVKYFTISLSTDYDIQISVCFE